MNRLTSLMLIATSVALLFQFGVMAVYGKFYIYEPNRLILILEILALIGATGVGIAGLIREVK